MLMDLLKMGEFIMKLRKKNKLTQSQLASLVFVTRETVGKWERGINVPDSHSLVLLSELFNISVNEIIAGELINDTNKDKINTLALDIINKEDIKRDKNRKSLIVIGGVLAIVFLLAYFIYNFNSMRVFIVTGENEKYSLSRSLIVISKQKSYIQMGSIIDKETKTNIASEKEHKISVYYDNSDEEKLLFSSMGSEPLYTNLNNHENDSYKELLNMIDNLYLVIEDDNFISKIKLNARLDYINNHLFSLNLHEDKENKTENEIAPLNQEEQNNANTKSNKNWITIGPIEYETENKKLSLSANCLEKENICQVMFNTTWKKNPQTKSYDLMGIRLSDTIFLDENIFTLANDEIEPLYKYNSHRGFGAIYNLSHNKINYITQTFNVEYRGSIYATYQHASKKLGLEDAKQFNFSSTGYGEVFSWENKKIQDTYDDMPGIKLILKEEK